VPAGGGHLQRPLEGEVTSHLRQVVLPVRFAGEGCGRVDRYDLWSPAPRKERRQLADRRHAHDVEARDERCFRHVVAWNDQTGEAGTAGSVCNRKGPPHRADGAIETELSRDRVAGEHVALDLTACSEDRRGECEVEAGAGLAQVSRRQIDGDAAKREVELRVQERGPHALA